MKWISIVFLGCLLVACGDDEPSSGSGGAGAGGSAEGGGGAGTGGSAEGGGGAGTGGSAEGGGGAGTGGHAEGGGGAGTGGSAEGGGGAGTGGHAEGGGGAGTGGSAEGGGGAGTGGSAEGGGGAGTGGSAEGGGGAGGSSLDTTELAIASDEAATAGCATFVDGAWGVGETDFIGGEPTNDDCALVPVLVKGNPYWIASRDFEGDIHIDRLEHSFSDAAAAIGEGSYSFVLRNFTFEEIFTGTLDVAYVTDDAVTLSIQ
ncbi:hypothetical protein [Sorangium sp. So ce1000]|uniref:hypothetical protein n=1 Tax=Sorangium sp. So ce1000 TaxID=3133325 RepID=UPI003F5DB5F2